MNSSDDSQQMQIPQAENLIRDFWELVDPKHIEDRLIRLNASQPLLNFEFGRGSIFWRARKCHGSEAWGNVSNMWYPSSDKSSPGRLNAAGEPMLYLSSRRFTVFSEIGAETGESIHVIGCRIKSDKYIRIGLVGDLFNVYRTGYSMLSSEISEGVSRILNSFDYEYGRGIVYVDAFFSSILRDKSAKQRNYVPSQILGRLLFSKVPEVSGLFYPSAEQEGGMILVVNPEVADDALEIVSSSIVYINRKLDFGMYDFSHKNSCTSIVIDGRFNWTPPATDREWTLLETVE